jgi:hypothetical protein
MADAAPALQVDLGGWDTAFAIRIEDVNADIARLNAYPRAFEGSLDGFSVRGEFGPWRVVPGGSAEIVQFALPLTRTVLSGALVTGEDATELSAVAFVQVRLAYFDGTAGDAKGFPSAKGASLRAKTTPTGAMKAAELQQIALSRSMSNPLCEVALKMLLQAWLTANLTSFEHVFAMVDLGRTARHQAFQWLQPSDRAYAYVDLPNRGAAGDGILAVLCMTGGRKAGTLAYQISPLAIPPDQQATFLISGPRVMQQLLLPCLPRIFQGTHSSDFACDPATGKIGLARPGTLDFRATDKSSGDSHACTLTELQVALEGENITFHAKTQYSPQIGIETFCTVDSTLGLVMQGTSAKPDIGFVVKKSNVVHTTEKELILTVAEDVAMAVGIVLTVIAIVLTDGAALLVIAAVAGLIGAAIGAEAAISRRIHRDDAPGLTFAALDASGGIAWPGEKRFALRAVALNGSLQLSGELA